MNPIFIVGSERSGTNLMRVILNSHSNIAIPHPPHILKNFFRLKLLNNNLEVDNNFRDLIKDVVKAVELHPYPWGIKIDKEKIFNAVKERNLINIFFVIYEQYLESTNKKRWGCKSAFMINYIAQVRYYYPQAKFIYMVRDGRDVAASAKKTIFNHYSVYYIAKLWKREQQVGIYWLNRLSESDMLLLRYEDLLDDPEGFIESICLFLNEPYEENMLDFFETNEAKKGSSISAAWKNTAEPILKNNYGKFKVELRKDEIELFEAIAVQELNHFHYELTNPASGTIFNRNIKFKIKYLFEEIFLMLKIQIKYFLSDKNNFLRYKKFWFLQFIKLKEIIK